MPESMAVPERALGARSSSGLMRKRWRFGPRGSPGATAAMRPPCWTRSRRTSAFSASPPTVPTTPAHATMPSPTAVPTLSLRSVRTPTLQDRHRRRGCTTRGTAGVETPRSGPLAMMAWAPPRKSCRDDDAVRHVVGAAARGTRRRWTGRGASGPHRSPERLRCARDARQGSCGISPCAKREPRA